MGSLEGVEGGGENLEGVGRRVGLRLGGGAGEGVVVGRRERESIGGRKGEEWIGEEDTKLIDIFGNFNRTK